MAQVDGAILAAGGRLGDKHTQPNHGGVLFLQRLSRLGWPVPMGRSVLARRARHQRRPHPSDAIYLGCRAAYGSGGVEVKQLPEKGALAQTPALCSASRQLMSHDDAVARECF